jgi:transposase
MPTKKMYKVQMYFSESEKEAYDDLMRVVKSTGLSVSQIAYASFVWGFYELARDDTFNMPLFRKESNAKKAKSKKVSK